MGKLVEGSYNQAIERAVTASTGLSFRIQEIVENKTGAMHDVALFKGERFGVFVKAGSNSFSADQFAQEAWELQYIKEHSAVKSPDVIAVAQEGDTTLLILEAVPVVQPAEKRDWEILGRGLAQLHRTCSDYCGLETHTYLGIFKQDNTPKATWHEFFGECRLRDSMRMAVDSGNLMPEHCSVVEKVISRLPEICPPQTQFSLLHGDPWIGNLLYTGKELVAIDCSIYYGNREIDLTTVDFFCPVSDYFFAAYREAYPIEPGFEERKDLWKMNQWLGHVTLFGGKYVDILMECARKYL